jgi:hypothetical protein
MAEGDREVSLDNVASALFLFWEKLIDENDPKPAIAFTEATTPSSNS